MRIILSFYLVIISLVSVGQNVNDLLKTCTLSGSPSAIAFKKDLEKFSDHVRNREKDTAFFFNAEASAFSFIFDKRIFEINIHYINDRIFWLRLLEYSDDSGPYFPNFISRNSRDAAITFVDSIFVNSLFQPYNTTNHTDFTWRDIYEDSTSVFGTGCGVAGIPPRSYMTVLYNVKANNHKAFIRQCKSLYPQVQIFGALGLYLLRRNGERLTEEEVSLFEKIKRSQELISVCEGCFFGERKKVAEVISDERLKGIYKHSKSDFITE